MPYQCKQTTENNQGHYIPYHLKITAVRPAERVMKRVRQGWGTENHQQQSHTAGQQE